MAKSKVCPVRRQVVPHYPDQYSTQLNHLLLENKPLRWRAVPVTGVVLSAVVMLGLAGCGAVTLGSPNLLPTPDNITMGEVASPPIYGTPFFEHGEGIGVYGCMAVAAPIFLSEADAFAIIRDEFQKLNLTVVQSDATVTTRIPMVDTNGSDQPINTQEGQLVFDFAVQGTTIAMEYVSHDDLQAWESTPSQSSVSTYPYKEAARALNNSLNDTDLPNKHGVFYTPAVQADYSELYTITDPDAWEAASEQLTLETQQRTEEALRAQVQDFIAWLSAQGVI